MKDFQDRRALIVDDQRIAVVILSSLLQRVGFQSVEVAHDGEEALARLRGEAFDVLISDIFMEPMGGIALTKAVRADAVLKDLPVILMTASRDPMQIVSAKRVGANACLTKPFGADALQDRLARLPSPMRAAGKASP